MKRFPGSFLLAFSLLAFSFHPSPGARADETVPRPFETDGCTSWFDGTRKAPTLWRHCCVRHDLAFWAGAGGKRDRADLDLRDCVAATGATTQAKLMYFGVRAGSKSPKKIAGMQWGNAWSPTVSRKSPLRADEIDLLERELLDPRYDSVIEYDYRRAFIESLRESARDASRK